MIVPEGSNKVYSRSVSTKVFKLLAILFAVWLIFLTVMTIYYGRLSYKAARAVMLEEENDRLRQHLTRVVEIEKSYKTMRELTGRIAEMAGIDLENIDAPPQMDLQSMESSVIDSALIDSQEVAVTERIPLTPEELAAERIPSGRPLYGWISRQYITGEDDKIDQHVGIDFAIKNGTDVKATASGVIIFAGWDKVFGYLVVINHGNGYETRYGHNEKLLVEKGQEVLKGDVIALSGDTGLSSAPHLHYEIRKDGKAVDPAPYLD
jgi:murein DD-endopeptidase MepM/ murein hydrolase activator NlpD